MFVLLVFSLLTQWSAMDDAIALMQQGRSNPSPQQGQADLQKAAEAFGKILDFDPKFAPAVYMRGCCYFYMRKDSKARADFEAAIALDPKLSGAYFYRGLVSMYTSRLEDAGRDFAKAIELEPANADYYSELARLKSIMGRGQQAMIHFNEALAVNPNHLKSLHLSATLLYKKGDLDEALKRWLKVLDLEPRHQEAHFKVALIYQAMGSSEKALPILEQLHDLNPKDWQVSTALIQNYQLLGQLKARDREIENLYLLRASDRKSKLAKEERFLRHLWSLNDSWVYGFEYFKPTAKKYSFMITKKDKRTLLYEISLSPDGLATEAARKAGEIGAGDQMYHLDHYLPNGDKSPLEKLKGDPGYDKLLERVIKIIEEKAN